MGANKAANAVFELGNDLSGSVVGCWICGEQKQNIQIKADGIAPDLNIPFFENVEKAHLNQFIEFGHLVHPKYPTVHPGNKPKRQSLLRPQRDSPGQFARVDFADYVGKLGARGQPFGITLLPFPPANLYFPWRSAGYNPFTRAGYGFKRIFVNGNIRVIHEGNGFIEKANKGAHQAAFGLSFLAKEQHIVASKDG